MNYIGMAYIGMAFMVMNYIVMIYVVMTDVVMAFVVLFYIVMAHIVRDRCSLGHSLGLGADVVRECGGVCSVRACLRVCAHVQSRNGLGAHSDTSWVGHRWWATCVVVYVRFGPMLTKMSLAGTAWRSRRNVFFDKKMGRR